MKAIGYFEKENKVVPFFSVVSYSEEIEEIEVLVETEEGLKPETIRMDQLVKRTWHELPKEQTQGLSV